MPSGYGLANICTIGLIYFINQPFPICTGPLGKVKQLSNRRHIRFRWRAKMIFLSSSIPHLRNVVEGLLRNAVENTPMWDDSLSGWTKAWKILFHITDYGIGIMRRIRRISSVDSSTQEKRNCMLRKSLRLRCRRQRLRPSSNEGLWTTLWFWPLDDKQTVYLHPHRPGSMPRRYSRCPHVRRQRSVQPPVELHSESLSIKKAIQPAHIWKWRKNTKGG